MLAVVRIPNSDNHVRYVIETLPLAGIAIAARRGDARAHCSAGAGAIAAALAAAVLVGTVEATRGARLSDYRFRGDAWASDKAELDRAAGYLRRNFVRNDLFLGYDEAFAAGRALAGRQRAARIRARHGALGARADRALAASGCTGRSRTAGTSRCAERATSATSASARASRRATRWRRSGTNFVLVRTRAPVPTPAAFARAGLRVFEAAQELSGAQRAPSKQAAVTAEALRDALPDLR